MALTKVPSNLDATVSTTQSASDNSTNVATTAYVTTAISALSDSAPAALNTLNEIAAALGDDANYASTTTAAIAAKLPLAGGTMTGALVLSGNTTLSTGGGALRWQNGYQTITGAANSNDLTYRTYSNHIFKTTTGASSTTDGTERMRIDTNLLVNGGAVSAPSYSFIGDTNTGMSRPTADTINFVTGGTERMRIDSSGNVLVGKTAESSATDGIELNRQDAIVATRNGDSPLILNRRTSDGDIALFRKDNTTVGSIGANGGYIYVGSSDTNLRFHAGADAILPANAGGATRSAAIHLGTSGAKFKDLHLSGTVNAGGTIYQGTATPTLHSAITGIVFENGSLLNDVTRGDGKSITLAQNMAIDSGNTWAFLAAGEGSYYQQYNGNHYFGTSLSSTGAGGDATVTSLMKIHKAGNVGIGSDFGTPSAKLEIKSSGGGSESALKVTDASGNNVFIVQGGGEAYFNYGPLGVGYANPATIFECYLTSTSGSLHNNTAAAAHFGSQGNADGTIQGISLGYKTNGDRTYRKTAIVARGLNDGAARQSLAFLVDTAADGGSAEIGDAKLTINGITGNVGIGTNIASAGRALEVSNLAASHTPVLRLTGSHTGAYSGGLEFYSGYGPKTTAEIHSTASGSQGGEFWLNVRSQGSNSMSRVLSINNAGRVSLLGTNVSGSGALNILGEVGNSYDAIQFYHNNSTVVGRIRTASGSTAFTSVSDYRLKENVDYTWDATARLKQLKPARFNFTADDTNTLVDGFLAHEVSSIVPEAITGEKDAVDSDGNPDYQGIDHSKLVPLLVKTIQELEARITTLEG